MTNRYRVVSLLGKGAVGEVYRADDLTLGQPVALKFLCQRLAASPAALARFHQEVRIARQVSHPNVCRVYDIVDANAVPFLSMEYVTGDNMRLLLRRVGRLAGERAVTIAQELCAGLAAAHDTGVLHRDLKPANVMIDSEGHARITDFGLAVIAGEQRGADVRSGTPAYMAPEQLSGRGVSRASDIYSLGLVLFELFTGRALYLTDSATARQGFSAGEPAWLSRYAPDLDLAIGMAILRCLARNPGERPASALDVAAALGRGEAIPAIIDSRPPLSSGRGTLVTSGASAASAQAWITLGLFLAWLTTDSTARRRTGSRRTGRARRPSAGSCC